MKRPELIALDVTYKCNLHCLHCFNFSGEENFQNRDELSDKELLQIADDIVKLLPQTLCICGGEPILRGEIIYTLIETIVKGTHGKTTVNMVSNGQAITKEVTDKLKKSGLYNFQVSLDGPDNESCDWIRNKKGAFDKAVSAIKYAKESGLNVSVACCPTKKNYQKISETIDLARRLGVNSFRVQPLMLLGRAQKNLQKYILSYVEYKNIVESLNKYKAKANDIVVDWADPIHHLLVIATESHTFYPIISINAYGDLGISPYIPISFGNIRSESLEKYWINGFYKSHEAKFYREICKKITAANNMDISNIIDGIPKNYLEKSLNIDIIKNKNYQEYTLNDLMDKVVNGGF